MATQNPYSDSLLADAFRGSLSNLESLGRGFAVAPVGLLGDVNALAREYITPRLPSSVQGLLQQMPAAPTTERILSNIPRVSAPRMETAGMEQLGAAMNPRGPVDLARGAGRLAGSAVNEAMVYGRGPLAAITPQPMRAVQQQEKGLFNIFDESTKYHQKVPEVKNINVTNLKRMNSGEVADVSDEVAANMDFSKPIQVSVFSDGELRIVDGHHRVAAAKKLGIQSLPVELQAINAKGNILNKLIKDSVYPQEEAMRLAQQRAALPVEQGGLGLAANNTAEQRAAAMGFDTDLLHGTDQSLKKFEAKRSISKDHGWYGDEGVYLTPDPNTASGYANWKNVGAGVNGKLGQELYGQNVMPLVVNRGNVFDYGDAPPLMDREKAKEFSETIKRLGFNTIEVPNKYASPEYKNNYETVILNPDDIRSRFAAFDPFRRNAAIAAAMGVAAPNLLAQEQPQSAGLLYPLP